MKRRDKVLRDREEFFRCTPQSGRGQIGNRKVFARNGQSAVIISRSHPGIVTGRIPGRHKESAFQAQRIENDLPGNIFKSLMPDFLQKQLEKDSARDEKKDEKPAEAKDAEKPAPAPAAAAPAKAE